MKVHTRVYRLKSKQPAEKNKDLELVKSPLISREQLQPVKDTKIKKVKAAKNVKSGLIQVRSSFFIQ